MKQGDLIVARFDNCLVVGMIIGSGERLVVPRHEHVFVYVCGDKLEMAQLSKRRLIQVTALLAPSLVGFSNLCTLTLSRVAACTRKDRDKLGRWVSAILGEANAK